jgi:hypothetical protein
VSPPIQAWFPQLLRQRRSRPRSHRTRCSAWMPTPGTGARCTARPDSVPSGMDHRLGDEPWHSGVGMLRWRSQSGRTQCSARMLAPRAPGLVVWCELIRVQLGWVIARVVSPSKNAYATRLVFSAIVNRYLGPDMWHVPMPFPWG